MRRLLFESALEKRKCREGVGEKNKIKKEKKHDSMATYAIHFMLNVTSWRCNALRIRTHMDTKLQFTQCLEPHLYYIVELIHLFALRNKTRITCKTLVRLSNELLMDFDRQADGWDTQSTYVFECVYNAPTPLQMQQPDSLYVHLYTPDTKSL